MSSICSPTVHELADLLGHCVSRDDGCKKTFSFTAQGGTETFGSTNQQADDQIGILLHGLPWKKKYKV